MGKLKKNSKRNTFDYNKNKKNLKRKLRRKDKPLIECPQIRKAWDEHKTVKQNLQDMGLSAGTKGMLPIKPKKDTKSDPTEAVVLKPYVIKEMEAEASLRGKDRTTCSTDMIEYVQHMVKEHNEDYKAMARDEKNYYQDTPKQIKRKVELFKRCHPDEYAAFIASLQSQKST
ncbi:nucleolar protein 16 [Pimephales promelas]|uniref:nucleolar protein 16 n=1 Tax=Pimephales promelas TaxID=90988 RepID=UPI001955DB8C|nr:nucleolar protein 16 [Pimephales promelas]KAG1969963.1 nucleolar protein [Pimephales promelas]